MYIMYIIIYMGQFVQGRKNGRLMSFFSASKTYEKQLRIEKTRLSHQVWSHGGSTLKKKDIKRPFFPPCRNWPICCFVSTRAHCGPWTQLQLCVAQDTLVRSNYCIQLHSAPADTDYCAHLLPPALGPCLCADATVPAYFCWLLHGILNVMRDYESESLR